MYVSLGISSFLYILGAATKSAQLPFTTWLPLAIAAPTPVRALVHSSTLVTAGIYLIYRGRALRAAGSLILLIFGAATATVGARARLLEYDLKAAIAYSTLRHCGLIIFGLGAGAPDAVFFHLCVHAGLKRLLFLLAGARLNQGAGAQDLRGLPLPPSSGSRALWALVGLNISRLPALGI